MSFPALRHERPCKNNKKKKEEQKDVWELNAENAHWSGKVAENLARVESEIMKNSLKENLKFSLQTAKCSAYIIFVIRQLLTPTA